MRENKPIISTYWLNDTFYLTLAHEVAGTWVKACLPDGAPVGGNNHIIAYKLVNKGNKLRLIALVGYYGR